MEDEEDETIWGYKSLRRKRRSVDPQEKNIKKGKAHPEKVINDTSLLATCTHY